MERSVTNYIPPWIVTIDHKKEESVSKSSIQGRAWKFGSHIDTDAILPAIYLNLSDPQELAKHCMEGIDRGFPQKIRPGDIVVAGENFGCGSSREHAPLALKASGIGAVVARSFARIFFRNALNIGLSIVECPDGADEILDGDQLRIDVVAGLLLNLDRAKSYPLQPFPPFMQELIAAGGLMSYVMQGRR